jgi:hypothetical protein
MITLAETMGASNHGLAANCRGIFFGDSNSHRGEHACTRNPLTNSVEYCLIHEMRSDNQAVVLGFRAPYASFDHAMKHVD